MKQISASAGQRVAVVRRAFSSLPIHYRFTAAAATPNTALKGAVEIRASRWIFPGTPRTIPLQEDNTVSAGLWNTFMAVDVIPEVDAVISVETRSLRHAGWLLGAALAIIVIAVVMIAFRG